MTSEISILKPLGYQRSTSCGYCKSSSGTQAPPIINPISHGRVVLTIPSDYMQQISSRKRISEDHSIDGTITSLDLRTDAWRQDYVLKAERKIKRQTRDKFDLLEAVHKVEYEKVQRPIEKRSKQTLEPEHKFEVNLEAAKFTKEKYDVFLKYQMEIHKDPKSRWGQQAFKRFLCDGLDVRSVETNNKKQDLGSYHQCYRLDGQLVAVGVLDLLPSAVSSVYLFYDPEFQEWEFGKMSAMREIALAIEGNYDWYYMGYYIHTCTKMRYKGSFEPSYLLDPESLGWNGLDNELRQKLDHRKYVCPSQDCNDDNLDTLKHDIALDTNANSLPQSNDTDYDVDSDPSDVDDTEIPEGSLFEYRIPGVLTKEAVRGLDLDHWKLLIRSSLVDFEDIRGWENQDIDDPASIKGIVAELAAAIGPDLLDNSAVKIF